MTPRPLTMAPVDWLMLLALSILWGGAFFLNKLAVSELPPFTVALARVGVAAAILLPIAWMRDELRPLRAAWPVFLTLGLVNSAVPFALIAWGQTQIASGLASILNATTPLFAVVIANATTKDDKLTRGRVVGLGCGLIGSSSGLGLHVAGGDRLPRRGRPLCDWDGLCAALPGLCAEYGSAPDRPPRRRCC